MPQRRTNIDSHHMLVVQKLRAKIWRVSNRQTEGYNELESELQGVYGQPLSLDEKCKILEETNQRVANK
jgi:hypothetical protein